MFRSLFYSFFFLSVFFFFFFNDTATTEIYTLSLHDALSISIRSPTSSSTSWTMPFPMLRTATSGRPRSEEHTSELQSHVNLVCRLLLEKKKEKKFLSFSSLKTKQIR